MSPLPDEACRSLVLAATGAVIAVDRRDVDEIERIAEELFTHSEWLLNLAAALRSEPPT